MSWLHYLAEANVYLGIFYLAYCVFLNRDTHYQLNRAYLIFTCIVSFVLPVLQLGALRPVKRAEPVNTISYAVPVQGAGIAAQQLQPVTPVPVVAHHFTLQDGLWYAYLAGAAVLLVMLFIKLYTVFRLMRRSQSVKEGKHRVIYLPGTDIAFSFFNYLIIGTNATGANTIIRHELVHIRQKHSADIIFLELLKIINWFNPFVYLVQNSLKTVHEYIADEQTAAHETDALTYSSFLINNAYGGGPSITHSFFNYNLLKKRIIMLNQKRSGKLARLKYLVTVPICAALLCASTLVFSKTYGWVDLAPASVKSAARYAVVSAGHPFRQKRLKITQNGISTITDKLSVAQKNKNVVYTASNITRADRSSLLKNNHIKVEVVEDSTRFTTRDGRLVLPVVNVDGYYLLDHFLHNNIHYTSAKGEKGGLVEVGFALDKDRHITDTRIVKSGGEKLDALALNGFNAYKGIVNDDPGKNLVLGVYFFTDDYAIFKTDSLQKVPDFAGELIITNYKYPVSITSKGYEYNEAGVGFPGNTTTASYARVIIYDKNGGGTWYYQNKCTPADLKMLKDKYGYTFPSAYSMIVQGMYPNEIKNKRLGYIFDVPSYLDAPYANDFYNHIMNNTEYPKQARKALTGGVVVLNFKLDKAGMISDVNVVQSAGNGFDEAAVAALQSYKFAIKDHAGRHSIALLFCVAEKQYRPVVGSNMKNEGYVGELAVSDVKSPFKDGYVQFPAPVAPGTIKTDKN
ncbi:MAG: TonB family protein [Bacteroidota bacterium]|nr:TonB family protein [Bacteroidota bacterium]